MYGTAPGAAAFDGGTVSLVAGALLLGRTNDAIELIDGWPLL
jgi:hypothetical protein